MGKLGELFKMSKQERAGAWAIAVLIVLLLAAVMIERRCSSDVKMSPGDEKELNEYIDGAKKSAPKKNDKKKTKNSDSSKSTSNNAKSKGKSQPTKGQKKKTTKKQTSKSSKSNSSRKIDPVPQF